MKQRRLNALLLVGMIGIFTTGSIFAVQIYRAFGSNQDIWWTAKTMALKIEEARDSFEIFIQGKSLQDHLADGTLRINREGNGAISSADIRVRINSWHKIQSSILANALLPCFLFGVSLTMLLIGFFYSTRFNPTHNERT